MSFAHKLPLHPISRPLRGIARFAVPLAALAAVTAPSAAHANTEKEVWITPKSDNSLSLGGDMTLKSIDLNSGDQKFVVRAASTEEGNESGAKTIVHQGTGGCLTWDGGVNIGLEPCAGAPEAEKARAQNWKIVETDGYVKIRPIHSTASLQRDGDKVKVMQSVDGRDPSRTDDYEMQKFLPW
ncbi:hypothetical protein YWIDRAFT_08251 [Streptomyces sp. SceaMP-e96]|uniref:RICIN domain-containing protein n=1 Tax=Streptomyces TaxID=1883 RepID=UPI000823B699|nr:MULTISPECIES: RICIN domain-containing protein [unclassified Streptomyces]MYT18518.1 hypothetical protein [Streptomyces sp. SID4951]SCK57211.1 hypothetical protein YWIDRAFT_08251 [Streptomyces sp. SceaMP-e96]